jgi:YD repeat-containing protein
MKTLTIAVLTLATVTAASAQNQTTFRDASGRITGTVTTDSNGTRTFRDGSGRTTGTATTDSNGTTTFRDATGRTTGTVSPPRDPNRTGKALAISTLRGEAAVIRHFQRRMPPAKAGERNPDALYEQTLKDIRREQT